MSEQNEEYSDPQDQIPDVEEEIEEYVPYDTEKISIDTKGMLLEACLRRIEQETIILAPDFQRNEVWSSEKKSRLIESILLKIPIPMFYVSADEKGIFSVVDGLQRLSAIRDFVLGKEYMASEHRDSKLRGNGFKLEKLEFWGNRYSGCIFNTLPIDMQNRILETEFTFTIINPGTPEEVKRNIFKRINTGGEPLTLQEIRNALYTGKATQFLKKLSQRQEFLDATSYSVRTNRMMDRELALRSLAFMIRSYTSYPKNSDMDRFLSDTMRIINIIPDIAGRDVAKFFKEEKESIRKEDIRAVDLDTLEASFISGMKRAKDIWGKHTFRRSFGSKRRAPINKALFEVWSVLLPELSVNAFSAVLSNKDNFLSEYACYLDEANFRNAISKDSLKFNSVQERHKRLAELLRKYSE
jgi:hypothetical protein